MAIIQLSDLTSIRARHKGEKIVFCSGSFDLLHAGHVEFLEVCKKLGDVLVVAVGSDEIIKTNKGDGRPIMSQRVRLRMVGALRAVDYCFSDVLTTDRASVRELLGHVLPSLRPDEYVFNDGTFDEATREYLSERHGVRWRKIGMGRAYGLSTTGIIEKIQSRMKG